MRLYRNPLLKGSTVMDLCRFESCQPHHFKQTTIEASPQGDIMQLIKIVITNDEHDIFVKQCSHFCVCVVPTTTPLVVYISVSDTFRADLFLEPLKRSTYTFIEKDYHHTVLRDNWLYVTEAVEGIAATTLHVAAPVHVEAAKMVAESLRAQSDRMALAKEGYLSDLQRLNKELEDERHQCHEAVTAQAHLLNECNELTKELAVERERYLYLERDFKEAKRTCGAELVQVPSYMNIRVGDMFVSHVKFKSWASALEFLLHKGFTYQGKGMYNRGDTEVSIVYPSGNDVSKYVEANIL